MENSCIFFLHFYTKHVFMRWDLTNTLNDSNHWVLNEDKAKAGLRYNKEAHSIRLNTDDRRLFFLEKTGVLQSNMLLRTEYSVVVGESYFGKNRLSGIMVVNENKYSFEVKDDRLKLFNKQKKEVVSDIHIKYIQNLEQFEFAGLLFASALIAGKQKARLALMAH